MLLRIVWVLAALPVGLVAQSAAYSSTSPLPTNAFCRVKAVGIANADNRGTLEATTPDGAIIATRQVDLSRGKAVDDFVRNLFRGVVGAVTLATPAQSKLHVSCTEQLGEISAPPWMQQWGYRSIRLLGAYALPGNEFREKSVQFPIVPGMNPVVLANYVGADAGATLEVTTTQKDPSLTSRSAHTATAVVNRGGTTTLKLSDLLGQAVLENSAYGTVRIVRPDTQSLATGVIHRGALALTTDAATAKDYEFVLPHHFENNDAAGGWRNTIKVKGDNLETVVYLTARGPNRQVLDVQRRVIPPGGEINTTPEELFARTGGLQWVLVRADKPVAVASTYQYGNLVLNVPGHGRMDGSKKLIDMGSQAGQGKWSGIAIVNPGETNATGAVSAYAADGQLLAFRNITIPAGAKIASDTIALVNVPADRADRIAYTYVQVSEKVFATGFTVDYDWNSQSGTVYKAQPLDSIQAALTMPDCFNPRTGEWVFKTSQLISYSVTARVNDPYKALQRLAVSMKNEIPLNFAGPDMFANATTPTRTLTAEKSPYIATARMFGSQPDGIVFPPFVFVTPVAADGSAREIWAGVPLAFRAIGEQNYDIDKLLGAGASHRFMSDPQKREAFARLMSTQEGFVEQVAPYANRLRQLQEWTDGNPANGELRNIALVDDYFPPPGSNLPTNLLQLAITAADGSLIGLTYPIESTQAGERKMNQFIDLLGLTSPNLKY